MKCETGSSETTPECKYEPLGPDPDRLATMTNCAPPPEPETAQLRANLREIRNEKSRLDDIEDDLEYARLKEDNERKKKREQEDNERKKRREQEDADIVRKRRVADQRREARQGKLCQREIAVRAKLKARKPPEDTRHLTPPALPYVRSCDEIVDSDSINSRARIRHKRPRTGGAVTTIALPQPALCEDNNTSRKRKKPVSSGTVMINREEVEAPTPSMKSLQDMVALSQIQSLPPVLNVANLPAFAAMPDFTREFISKFIGGSKYMWGRIRLGRYQKLIECDEYLVLNPNLNPYLPSAPGQHFAYLDLQCSSKSKDELIQRKVFPVFLPTSAGSVCYSGHYRESIPSEKVKMVIQRQLVSAETLQRWIESLFDVNGLLSYSGLPVLLSSGLYTDPDGCSIMPRREVEIAIKTRSGNRPYTKIPFWFRFLQCVRFDRTFQEELVAKTPVKGR